MSLMERMQLVHHNPSHIERMNIHKKKSHIERMNI